MALVALSLRQTGDVASSGEVEAWSGRRHAKPGTAGVATSPSSAAGDHRQWWQPWSSLGLGPSSSSMSWPFVSDGVCIVRTCQDIQCHTDGVDDVSAPWEVAVCICALAFLCNPLRRMRLEAFPWRCWMEVREVLGKAVSSLVNLKEWS